jgi:hypothetical protein
MPLKIVRATLALCGSLLVVGCAHTEDASSTGEAVATPSADEMTAMMESFEKAAAPGPEHAVLQKFVGSWNTVAKSSGMPGMPATETKGWATFRSVLGGRQVVEETHGSAMGKPFSGYLLMGYDNVTREYVGTWTDTMSTGQFQARGTADASGKVITLNGLAVDVMSPVEPRAWRLVLTIESDDRHRWDIYDTVAPGQMAHVMSIAETRSM